MAVPYHTHTFDIPVASTAEAEAGLINNKVITPAQVQIKLSKASNLSDLEDAAEARDNLGVSTYATKAAAEASTIPASVDALRVNGGVTLGDGLGGLYIDTDNGSADTFDSSGGTARTWYRAPDVSATRLVGAPDIRTFLGLGDAATLDVGTTAGTVAAGDDARIVGSVRFDVAQATSFSEKAQGRENVGLEAIVPDVTGPLSFLEYSSFYEGTTVLNVTYGGGQSAVGSVVSINDIQFGVPNYIADPTLLSTHASRDHVGQFVFMQGAQETQVIPDLGTTYGATYIQNAAIVASDNMKPGMVIDTRHSPKWSGVITSVDDGLNRAIVDAWYRVDGSSTTGTPANGTGANSNPTTKVFGGNTAVWFGKDNSLDVDGHGHELDMVFWRAGLGVYYGWDAVVYGDFQPTTNIAHSARWGGDTARFTGGFYAEDTIDDGAFWGLWRAGGDYVRPLLKSKVGSDTLFSMTAAGQRNADRVTYVKTAVNLTVNAIGTCVVICTNAAGTIDITLPAFGGYNDGRVITVVTLGAGSAAVKKPAGTTINTLATGEYQDVLSDGTDWLPIKSGPVV